MLSAIKAAAAKIIGAFKAPAPKPTPGGVTKPIGTIGPGGLQPTVNPQANNFNPQGGAPSPQSTYNPQARTVNPQAANSYALAQQRLSVQRAAQQQIEIETARRAAAAEAARKQGVKNEFDKIKASWLERGNKTVDSLKGGGKKSWTGKLVDFATLGPERRAGAARKFAQEEGNRVATVGVKRYESNLNKFLAEQAKRKAAVEGAKFGTQAEFQLAADSYNAWEAAQIAALEHERAKTAGLLQAYNAKSQAPINTPVGKAASWLNQQVISKMGNTKIFKYTLGSGSSTIPSIVTAPARALNTANNYLKPNRTINLYGGGTLDRKAAGLNAWQASFNQRNTNLAPYKEQPYTSERAKKVLNERKIFNSEILIKQFKMAHSDQERQLILRRAWDEYQITQKRQNTLTEMVRDPLNLAGGSGIVAKGVKDSKYLAAAKGTKALGWAFKASDKVAEAKTAIAQTRAVQWLGKPAETRADTYRRVQQEAGQQMTNIQGKYFPAVKALSQQLAGKKQLDYAVFDEIEKLTDSEAKMLQKMVDGRLTRLDRVRLAGKGLKPIRDRLESLSARYAKFSDEMAQADKVTTKTSRFGLGRRRAYYANTSWLNSAERKKNGISRYNFREFKRHDKYIQDSAQLHRSQIDRLFKSDIEAIHAETQHARKAKLIARLKAKQAAYDAEMAPVRADVQRAYDRTRTPIGRLQAAGHKVSPTKLWKKSVLKYRPAWTVNNVLYNTQAAVLAGGPGAAIEHVKMLNPRYWRKVMDELPKGVKADVAPEMGKGRLNRVYNRIENTSRAAAFKAAKAKGLTDAQATARVNKYLFDYTTKNWERPFRAVMPFWGFQKNLTKAAITMPLDQPAAALIYNRFGRFQEDQFNKDFESIRTKLKDQGYTDEEIDKFKTDQAKYYKGKLKVGGKYVNTPFNAFSDRGLATSGVNPYLAAVTEAARSVDSFGSKIKGATLKSRLISKFPQVDLGQKYLLSRKVNSGSLKPHEGYIGAAGSEGYGLTKDRQGYDKTKPNYVAKMDPRNKLTQDAAAFLGMPRSTEFDKNLFLRRKLMAKVKTEYFGTDWKSMKWEDSQAKQAELFKKWGITADEFFKGELSKNDSDATKLIKAQKEQARALTDSLYKEYGAQPKGTRNIWATKKLKELVDSGYFEHNPFLHSFDWTNPTTIAKAYRQMDYLDASRTGDWSKWRSKYGESQKAKDYQYAVKSGDWSVYRSRYGVKQTAKSLARDYAVRTGDWSKYRAAYGTSGASEKAKFWTEYFATDNRVKRRQMIAAHPEFAKPKTADEKAAADFWAKYMAADPNERKTLIRQHPEFNSRKDWTQSQWLQAKRDADQKDRANILGVESANASYKARLGYNYLESARINSKIKRTKKILYKL